MSDVIALTAFIEDGGNKTPFELRIAEPVRSPGAADYLCRISAPVLFADEKCIYGVDAEQAIQLALRFVETLLGERTLVDAAGNPIRLR